MAVRNEFELAKAAKILVEELLGLKEGEEFVITVDTSSEIKLAEVTAAAAHAIGAKPMIILTATPPGPANMVDDFLPSASIGGALERADAWVEFNNMYLLYSQTSNNAFKKNKKLRELVLPHMDDEVFVRMFAETKFKPLSAFMEKITEMTRVAEVITLKSDLGMDISFKNHPLTCICCDTGYALTPGIHQLCGQIGWEPDFDTINGEIVFDGSLVPQVGIVDEPVHVFMEKGRIVKIEGGAKAREWENYLASFNDPQMYGVSHVCYGFHPNAKLAGHLGEDERVWGCTQWGFGSVGMCPQFPDGIPAASHTDGISLNTTVLLDGKEIMHNGKIVAPELVDLARKLGK